MKKYGIIVFLVSLSLLSFFGCMKKESKKGNSDAATSQESKKIEYYTCSMHPWVRSDKPGNCPACGMALTPVYAEGEERRHEHSAPTPETSPAAPEKAKKEKKILYYVDPMHPVYKSDKPGKAPDCGMDLVPVYDEGGTSGETQAMKETDRATVRLSSEKQQLIGVKTEEVQRRPLSREINAAGRVAFDPDLLIAQNEYLAALRTPGGELAGLQSGLIHAAKQRLLLLGMSEPQIQDLARKRKPQTALFLPQKGEAVWIYASLFESDLSWVKPEDPVKVFLSGSSEARDGMVESIDPTIDPMTRTVQARARVSNPEGRFKPNMFVQMTIEARGGEVLAVPETALISTGKREIAFVDKGQGRFEPRVVKIGRRGTGYVEVFSGLSEGEKVVTSANFLIDSESRLKAALSGMGGHQH